jgi:hypothetical protein
MSASPCIERGGREGSIFGGFVKVSKQSWRIAVVGAVGELGSGSQTQLAECRQLENSDLFMSVVNQAATYIGWW